MILCSHCGAANEDGSSYCLECGTELAAPQPKPPASTGDAVLSGDAPAPTVNCSACGAMNPMQEQFCVACGARLDYAPAPLSSPEIPAVQKCPSCQADVPASHEFCGACGANIVTAAQGAKRATQVFGDAQQTARARLVLIRGEGFEGASFDLNADRQVAGRSDGEILFTDDEYLSPRHAEFVFRDAGLFVCDLDSLNGVYRRIEGRAVLEDGDIFVVGEQVFRFDRAETLPDLHDVSLDPNDDTAHQGSSAADVGSFSVSQILRGGQLGNMYFPPVGEMSLGREGCDLNFPEDQHLSRLHARVFGEGEQVVIQDMDSKNGSFLKIRAESELRNGDLVFLGQQLLRVEITG